MALWENLSRKASMVAEKAVQQAKDLSEQVKLRGQIADEEKTITDSYTQIGKQYAELHPEDYEEVFAGWFAAIENARRRAEVLRAQLRDLKGVALCPRCGGEVAADASFCSACGAPMPKEEPREAEIVTEGTMVEVPAQEPVCDTPEEG